MRRTSTITWKYWLIRADNIEVSRRIVVLLLALNFIVGFWFVDLNGCIIGLDDVQTGFAALIAFGAAILFSFVLLMKDKSTGWRVFAALSLMFNSYGLYGLTHWLYR